VFLGGGGRWWVFDEVQREEWGSGVGFYVEFWEEGSWRGWIV
jgi:hypothetical protein